MKSSFFLVFDSLGASVLSADSFYAGLGLKVCKPVRTYLLMPPLILWQVVFIRRLVFLKKQKNISWEVLFLAAESASVLLCGWPWKGTSVWCYCLLKQITQLATVLLMPNYQKISRLGPSWRWALDFPVCPWSSGRGRRGRLVAL